MPKTPKKRKASRTRTAAPPQVHQPTTSSAPVVYHRQWKLPSSILLGLIIFLFIIWNTGILQNWLRGPKIPLPHHIFQFHLGMSLKQVQALLPTPIVPQAFNDNSNFKIVSLHKPIFSLPQHCISLDLLFYHSRLYFINAMWIHSHNRKFPLHSWISKYRHWSEKSRDSTDYFSKNTILRSWHFNDALTSLTLRALTYNSTLQYWEDLRDISNQTAQLAFSKYRLTSHNLSHS
jgi:hypothetical protein